jgi:predicted PurR-regulated permease PerM
VSEPQSPKPVVVPRWIQLVVLPLALLALYALARAASTVTLIFLVSSVIALILNPLVKRLQEPLGSRAIRLPRGVAVAAVYLGFVLVLVGAGALLANPVTDQIEAFQRDVPELVDSANSSLAGLQEWLDDRGVDIQVKEQGEDALQTLQRNVLNQSGDLVSFGQDLLVRIVETGFGLILVIVISIYMLLYADRIGSLVRSVMPPGDGTPEDDYSLRVQKAVFGYVRGQLLFSLIMGTSAGIVLWILGAIGIFPDGKTYALFFGIFFGLMEMVPYIGPVLGAAAPVLVALFDDPLTAVWVTLTFIALQQLEGHVVAPQVFGHSLRINPLLVIFALLVGGELYGILGALVALPLAAVARETVIYLRKHLVLEPWGTINPVALAGGEGGPPVEGRGPPEAIPPPKCAECGTVPGPDDAYCRTCGAPLGPRVTTPP